mmetsp:Transcript_3496/g.4796  ORF Transcript_3496/g.4796 Transcript_3496/m.4796 type:complete len:322 (-) Transcript_3496:1054-2019(-)
MRTPKTKMKVPTVEKTTVRVLLLQHSLSGETNTATHEFIRGLEDGVRDQHNLVVDLVEQRIQTQPAFDFPWNFWSFFAVMPETVDPFVHNKDSQHWQVEKPSLDTPVESSSPNISTKKKNNMFDLVVLGWQTWFLSPSLPVRMAVNDPDYQHLLQQAPVLMIGTHRNMWHRASRTLRQELDAHAHANIVGSINFVQSSAFLVSVVKTLRWQLGGKIESSGATNAKDQAYAEGLDFANQYKEDGSWPVAYEAGKPYSETLAFLEDVWFPVKKTASSLMGAFPPDSVGRCVITVAYLPLILSAIVFLVPPILFVGTVTRGAAD